VLLKSRFYCTEKTTVQNITNSVANMSITPNCFEQIKKAIQTTSVVLKQLYSVKEGIDALEKPKSKDKKIIKYCARHEMPGNDTNKCRLLKRENKIRGSKSHTRRRRRRRRRNNQHVYKKEFCSTRLLFYF
jgi:hypothetical protein